MAGVTPLPPVASCLKSIWNNVARFGKTYKKRTPGTYTAKPENMYYMPQVRGHDGQLYETHHVGFVMDDSRGASFESLDGNGKGGGNWAIMTANKI